MEENNSHFVILRSLDGIQFDSVGVVSGAGNSRQVQNYLFTDPAVPAGGLYYRLRQVDYDGSYSFSESIHLHNDYSQIQLYPNPFSRGFVLRVLSSRTDKVSASIHTVTGVELYHSDSYKTNSDIILGDNLTGGVYIVKVQSGGCSGNI